MGSKKYETASAAAQNFSTLLPTMKSQIKSN